MTRRDTPGGREARLGLQRERQMRTELAQAAAKLIIEHGIDDWEMAKRKAARQLGVFDGGKLPSSEELEQAIRDYNSLFRPQSQAAMLYARRSAALKWMQLLSQFSPRLTAGVANGLASAHSDIRIEVVADDGKQVELFLLARELAFELVAPAGAAPENPQYLLHEGEADVRLVVLPPTQRRSLGRERLSEQLDIGALQALLAAG
jgi:hypothetical protein